MPKRGRDAGPEGFDQHVGGAGQPEEIGAALLALEVEHHALLAAAHVAEEHRGALVGRADVAAGIALARRLDLDHLGAVIGQRGGEIRSRQEPRQVDDLQSFELHVRLPSRESLSAPSGEQAAWAGRSPSMRMGLAMTRRLALHGMRHGPDHAGRAGEAAVERLVQPMDRRRRQEPVERLEPLAGRARAERRIERFGERGAIHGAGVGIGKARVVQKLVATHGLAQRQPEFLGHAHDEDPAVPGRKGLDRRQRQVRAARHPGRDVALVEIPDAGIGELVHGDVVQAGLDVAALPCRAGAQQTAQQADDAGQAAHAVDQRDADTRRRAVRLAGQLHQSRLGLHQEIVARPVRALVGAAIGRDVQADDRRA